MALTVDSFAKFSVGNRRCTIANVDFDASYPTGGESLSLSDLGFSSQVDFVVAESKSGYVFSYDRTNKKLLAYYFDYDAGADGAAIQVANTTDISAVTDVRVFALGI